MAGLCRHFGEDNCCAHGIFFGGECLAVNIKRDEARVFHITRIDLAVFHGEVLVVFGSIVTLGCFLVAPDNHRVDYLNVVCTVCHFAAVKIEGDDCSLVVFEVDGFAACDTHI